MAIEEYHRILDLDPNYFWAHNDLGQTYVAMGKIAEGIAELKIATDLDPQNPQPVWLLAWAYAKAGRNAEARKELNELLRFSSQGFTVSYGLAIAYASLNEKDRAFESLSKAVAEHDPSVKWLKVDVPLENLRDDPRYHKLLKRVGLEK